MAVQGERGARRRVDVVTAVVVLALGIPLLVLGVAAGVQDALAEPAELEVGRLLFLVLVAVGLWRAWAQLRRRT